jgi:hypothetical protein
MSFSNKKLAAMIDHASKSSSVITHNRTSERVNSDTWSLDEFAAKVLSHLKKNAVKMCTSLLAPYARPSQNHCIIFEYHLPFVFVVGHGKIH